MQLQLFSNNTLFSCIHVYDLTKKGENAKTQHNVQYIDISPRDTSLILIAIMTQ